MTDHPHPVVRLTKEVEFCPKTGLRFCLLGGFRLLRGEKVLSADRIRLRKARDLLKLLALAPEHRLHREQLLEWLWPECAPDVGAHNLSQTLYTLRPSLIELDPTARVQFEDERLVLIADGGVSTDVEDFEQTARLALSHSGSIDSQTADCCQTAIVAYTGDLLPEDGPSDLFGYRRDELRQFYINLLLQLADYNLESQEYLPAIDSLQKAISADLANEGAHTRLMRAYALNGQRQAALRQFQILQDALRRELDVEPAPESQRLREQIFDGELAPRLPSFEWALMPHHNLPAQVSSFIGREREVAEVQGMVQKDRLVTLTGSGGIGKTRLALKAAENLLAEFPQGIFWIELDALSNSGLVAKAVLGVFQLPEKDNLSETDRLINFLKNRHLLLILDNCEHLISGCTSLVAMLLKACPQLHILVTSRVRLNLAGENTYRVPPLAMPDLTHMASLTELIQFDAVRLLIERLSSYSHGFTLTTANAPAVAHICRRLDGIPLALELAAARSRMMTVDQIAERLDDIFRLLVGGSQDVLPRQRTLQASIEWSYSLLSRKERLLLQRLSIFAGGWGLEAAEKVCSDEEISPAEVLDLLGNLVDQSLVIVEIPSAGEARYRLLETVHQYAYERLVDSSGESVLRQRHLDYFLRLAQQADLELRGPEQLIWIKRLEKEGSNLINALDGALSLPSCVEAGVKLACALSWYWGICGDFFLQRTYLGKMLMQSVVFGRTPIRARILFQAASASTWGGNLFDRLKEQACIEESLAIWRELGQDYLLEEAQCLLCLGWIKISRFHDPQGLALMDESRLIFQHAGDTWWQAWALNLISEIREKEKNEDRQAIHYLLQEDSILWRRTGDRWGQALPLMAWGQFTLRCGDFAEAQDHLRRSLEILKEFGSKGIAFQALRDLGHAARGLQEYDQAETYYKNCVMIAQEIGWNNSLSGIHCNLGYVSLRQGNIQQAQTSFDQSMWIACELNSPERRIHCIAGYAALGTTRGKISASARLFGAFTTLVDAHQIRLSRVDQLEIDHFLELCRAQIEKAAFDQAWQAGSALTLAQAEVCAQESVGL